MRYVSAAAHMVAPMYDVYIMKRKQIYIEDDQERRLKELAAERQVPESVLVRAALSEYLAKPFPRFDGPEDNPLWGLVGVVEDADAPRDGSTNHDHYIYGTPKKYKILDDGSVQRVL
ncbi:MAG TPA: CopG family transcriptional regulator [Dehalococcoidia bacterium]